MRDALEHAFHTGAVLHLVGGSDAEADALVEEVRDATDIELRHVVCTPETTTDALPSVRSRERAGTLVYYQDFGELPSDVQVSAAESIKAHFEYGVPVMVRSNDESRGDLTLCNGDLRGRVRTIELDG